MRIDTHVDGIVTSVGIGIVLRLDGIGEAVFFTDIKVKTRVHTRSAKDVIQKDKLKLTLVGIFICQTAHDDVREVVLTHFDTFHRLVPDERNAFKRQRIALIISEILVCELKERFERDVPDASQHHTVGSVVLVAEFNDIFTGVIFD